MKVASRLIRCISLPLYVQFSLFKYASKPCVGSKFWHRNTNTMSGSDGEQQQHISSTGDSVRQQHETTKHKPRRGQKKRDTHFLCFPMVNEMSVPQLAASLAHFKSITSREASQTDDDTSRQITDGMKPQADNATSTLRIIGEKAFRPPGTYHLTLGVMDLSTPEKMNKALNLLRSIDIKQMLVDASSSRSAPQHTPSAEHQPIVSDSIEPSSQTTSEQVQLSSLQRPISPPALSNPALMSGTTTTPPLELSLTGLSTFPRASTARVFYAKPQDPTSRLHGFAVAIRQKFRQVGLITENRPLVLHATVGNLRYAVTKSTRGGYGRGRPAQDEGQVDARDIIKVFDEQGGRVDRDDSALTTTTKEEFVWAENVVVDQLAICKLGATKSEDPVLELEYPPIATRSIYGEGEEDVSRRE